MKGDTKENRTDNRKIPNEQRYEMLSSNVPIVEHIEMSLSKRVFWMHWSPYFLLTFYRICTFADNLTLALISNSLRSTVLE
jgi:hypothetical protein